MGRFLLIIGALFFIMAADKAGASDPENQIFLDLKAFLKKRLNLLSPIQQTRLTS